jgi:hypothetical protein
LLEIISPNNDMIPDSSWHNICIFGFDAYMYMDKRTKVIVCVAVAHKLLSMMVMIIQSRKRK